MIRRKLLSLVIFSYASLFSYEMNLNEKLIDAIEKGNLKNALDFISQGAEVNINSKYHALGLPDYTPLIYAIKNNDLKMIELLLSKGANIGSFIAAHSESMLYSFFYKDSCKEIVDIFTQDLYFLKCNDFAALHYAVAKNSKEITELLIKSGADVNIKNTGGFTPLHFAVIKGYSDIAQRLISAGADLNCKLNNKGTFIYRNSTPLIFAIEKDDLVIIKMLIKAGVKVREEDQGSCPLATAMFNSTVGVAKRAEMAKFLILAGADISSQDHDKFSLLGDAVRWENEEIVKLMIDRGAWVNTIDKNRFFPLHHCVEVGNANLVKIVMRNCPNLNAKDQNGNTPLKIAKKKNFSDIYDILKKAGAKE